MTTIPVTVMGPSYQDRSPQLSSQYTQNVYLGQSRQGEATYASYDWPGCKAFYAGAGADRGSFVFLNTLYKVSGDRLVSIDANGSLTDRGSIPGNGLCIFAISFDSALDDYGLLIATEGIRYYYNQAAIVTITDVDLTTGYSVAVMNDVVIFDNENGILTHTTYGQPTNVSSFFATTNTSPDGLQRVYVYGQVLLAFGTQDIEQWFYNGATTEFIFTRQEQATIPIGLAARYSVASDENYVIFLGSDKRFYRFRGASIEPIVTPGISNEIESMAMISDAQAFTLKMAGQSFYVVTFPTENKTLYYSISLNYWGHLSFGTDAPQRHLANSYALVYNKHYVGDYRNGNVYEWDFLTYTDNGAARRRERIMSPITGTQIGIPGRSITAGRLTLDMEVGSGLATGQGSDPMLMCSVSGDGGKTFSEETFVPIGIMGDYKAVVNYDKFTTGRSLVYKLACSDPVYLSIFAGSAEVSDGGY